MDKLLNTKEIKFRSLKGVKWLLFMNAIGIPIGFLISVLLGRIGPAVLGMYALAQILIGVITTFVVYGGSSVLPVLISKITDKLKVGNFIFSYTVILLVLMTAVLFSFWIFPSAFEFLLQNQFNMQNYGWFILLSVTIVLTEIIINTASGLMLIKVTAIARQVTRFVLFLIIIYLFVFNKEFLKEYTIQCILGGYLIGYLLAFIFCSISIKNDKEFKIRIGWFIPPGFWALSLSTMSATIFTFFYGNFDRIAILSIKDVKALGIYQAAISINTLLELIPSIIIPSALPTFSRLLHVNIKYFKDALSILSRWSVIPITCISLAVMGFSKEILFLFGKQYGDYSDILTLFGLAGIVRSLNLPTLVVLTCMEKNTFRFFQSFLMIIAQGVLTFLFINNYGILAIAGAKVLSVSVASFAGVLYITKKSKLMKIPSSYKVAVLAGIVMSILKILIIPDGWLPSIGLTLLSVYIFVVFSNLNRYEFGGIIKFIYHHDVSVLTKISNRDQHSNRMEKKNCDKLQK